MDSFPLTADGNNEGVAPGPYVVWKQLISLHRLARPAGAAENRGGSTGMIAGGRGTGG